MFSGKLGKEMMIEQGYVPASCVLDDEVAGLLIHSEILAGRDPCVGCNHDRQICGGRPRSPGGDEPGGLDEAGPIWPESIWPRPAQPKSFWFHRKSRRAEVEGS